MEGRRNGGARCDRDWPPARGRPATGDARVRSSARIRQRSSAATAATAPATSVRTGIASGYSGPTRVPSAVTGHPDGPVLQLLLHDEDQPRPPRRKTAHSRSHSRR